MNTVTQATPKAITLRWEIRRADGELIDGDMLEWHSGGDGPEPDWTQVDGYDHDEATEYIAERVQVVETRTRTLTEAQGVDTVQE